MLAQPVTSENFSEVQGLLAQTAATYRKQTGADYKEAHAWAVEQVAIALGITTTELKSGIAKHLVQVRRSRQRGEPAAGPLFPVQPVQVLSSEKQTRRRKASQPAQESPILGVERLERPKVLALYSAMLLEFQQAKLKVGEGLRLKFPTTAQRNKAQKSAKTVATKLGWTVATSRAGGDSLEIWRVK